MMMRNKRGLLQGTVEVILTLILFFIFYQFVAPIFDALAENFEGTIAFMISAMPYFILFAIVFWIFTKLGEE